MLSEAARAGTSSRFEVGLNFVAEGAGSFLDSAAACLLPPRLAVISSIDIALSCASVKPFFFSIDRSRSRWLIRSHVIWLRVELMGLLKL